MKKLLIAAMCLGASQSVLAWNDMGHKTVAMIAWEELTPKARAKLVELIPKHPMYASTIETKNASGEEKQIQDMMTAATWADIVRNKNAEYRYGDNWHVTVFPFITGNLPEESKPKPWSGDWKPGEKADNIMQGIKKCEADLLDPKSTDIQKSIALVWLLHITGDIHQPLHTTSWYSEEHPDGEGDKRGNYTYINTGGNSNTALHAYWDDIVGSYKNLEATRTIAHDLKKENPRSVFGERLKETDSLNWGLECHKMCVETVYQNGKILHSADNRIKAPVLTKEYQDSRKTTGRSQVTLAGYRMADQLNRLLDSSGK